MKKNFDKAFLKKIPEDQENLGLDADGSSDNESIKVKYNSDNDRISHNEEGEEDPGDAAVSPGYSPLSDK